LGIAVCALQLLPFQAGNNRENQKMKLTVHTQASTYNLQFYNDISINLKYQSIMDTFQFKIWFNPDDPAHQVVFQPGAYYDIQLYDDNGILLITGTMLTVSFESNETNQWVTVAGYSKTGILEDCYIPAVGQTTWPAGSTLTQIATSIANFFGLQCVIDSTCIDDCETPYSAPVNYYGNNGESEDSSDVPTVKDFLLKLAEGRNVILSHTTDGKLLLTRTTASAKLTIQEQTTYEQAIADQPSVEDWFIYPRHVDYTVKGFNPVPLLSYSGGGRPVTNAKLQFDGQKMWSDIFVMGQAAPPNVDDETEYTSNPVSNEKTPLKNPYCTRKSNNFVLQNQIYRPTVTIQTTNSDQTVAQFARAKLGADLQSMTLVVEMKSWYAGNASEAHLIQPNALISFSDKYLYLYRRNLWFIREVQLNTDAKGLETATLVCVLPDCFNESAVNEIPNVFAR
jgi:prophage tail gpP-like protein